MSTDLPVVAGRGVCMITADYPPVGGGAEVSAARLSEFLAKLRLPVTVVTMRDRRSSEMPPSNGVRVLRVDVPEGDVVRALVFIARALAVVWQHRRDFDVLHTHQLFSATVVGVFAQILLGYPLVVKASTGGHVGDVEKIRRKGWMGRLRFWLIRRRAAAFISISREITAELKSIAIDDRRIVPMPNVVDTLRFRPCAADEKVALRALLGLPREEAIVVYAGRLVPVKGLGFLLQAMAGVDARLVIVGDGPEREELEKRAARDLPGRVTFTGRREDVERWFMAADVAVLPSLAEGMPLAMLEAMACGLPVIVTAVGGAVDLIRDGESGYLVQPRDSQSLGLVLRRCLADPVERSQVGKRARSLIEMTYAGPLVAERYAALYDRLRSDRRCPPLR